MRDRTARLREEFDRSFTEVPRAAATELTGFVLVHSGGERYAMATEGLSGIEHARQVLAVPSRFDWMIGLAGVRGAAIPVFTLSGLLGKTAAPEEGWWKAPIFAVMQVVQEQLAGVAFDRLEQFVRIDLTEVLASSDGFDSRVLSYQGELYSVVEPNALRQRIVEPGL